MANPAWRSIGGGHVPERPGVAWTTLVENVTPGKVIKIEVARTGQPAPANAAKVAAARAEAKAAADTAAETARKRAAAVVAATQALAKAEADHAASAEITQKAGDVRTAADASIAAETAAATAKEAVKIVDAMAATDQIWAPKSAGQCTADGNLSVQPPGTDKFVLLGAPSGCLIGRLGGSSVDMTADSSNTPSRIIFSVGRLCVLVVPDSVKGGGLFLGANDIPGGMGSVTGQLEVNVYEAL
jgi:hypothetical protein